MSREDGDIYCILAIGGTTVDSHVAAKSTETHQADGEGQPRTNEVVLLMINTRSSLKAMQLLS